MSIRHMDGFRKYVASGALNTKLARVYSSILSGDITYAAGRYATSGGFLLYADTGDNGGFSLALSASGVTKFIHGFCVKATGSAPRQETKYQITGGGTSALVLSDAGVSVNATAKGDLGLNDGEWHHVEWVQYASGTDSLYVDGVLIATQVSTAFGTAVRWFVDGDDIVAGYQISDWYILDNTGTANNVRLGPEARVETLLPSADDATQQWSVSGAANAFNVLDNVPDNSGQFIGSNADNQIAQVQFTNLTGITTVAGIQLSALAKNEDGGTLKKLNFVKGGTEVGAEWTPTTSLGLQTRILEENPSTDLPWTPTNVNGLVAGLKSKTE